MEWLLTQTIEAGRKSGAIDESSTKRVAVDTTVIAKAIADPTVQGFTSVNGHSWSVWRMRLG